MYSKKDNLLFIHIPKTGGQTILLHFLEKHNIGWNDRGKLYGNKIQVSGEERIGEHLTYQEYIDYNIISKDEMLKLNKISIVRNPYDRFLSYFYMKKNKTKFSNLGIDILMKDCKELFLSDEKDIKYSKPYVMMKPQYLFLENAKDVKVFKYENYGEVESYLKNYNIEKIKKRNIGSKKAKLNYNIDFKKCIDFVNEHFKKDFETFDYKMI